MLKVEIFTEEHHHGYYREIVVKFQSPFGRVFVDEIKYREGISCFKDFFDLLYKACEFLSYKQNLSTTYHVDNCEGSQQTHSCSG